MGSRVGKKNPQCLIWATISKLIWGSVPIMTVRC